jgi:hypothetical protein
MAAYYANPSVLAHTTSLQPYMLPDDPNGQFQGSSIYNLPTDSEGEAEVDELESDTDDEPGASASTTAGQKKSGKRVGERVPGTALLPISRVENIIQADGTFLRRLRDGCGNEVHDSPQGITSNLSMSKEAAFVLSIAAVRVIYQLP